MPGLQGRPTAAGCESRWAECCERQGSAGQGRGRDERSGLLPPVRTSGMAQNQENLESRRWESTRLFCNVLQTACVVLELTP